MLPPAPLSHVHREAEAPQPREHRAPVHRRPDEEPLVHRDPICCLQGRRGLANVRRLTFRVKAARGLMASFEGCQFTAHVLEALRCVWLIGGSLRPPEEGKWLNYNSLGLSAPSIFASRCLVFLFGKLSAVSYITWHAKPYRISRSAVACKHMCLELAYARVVSRGGPRGGQHGKDFRPQKKAAFIATPQVALDLLRQQNGLG